MKLSEKVLRPSLSLHFLLTKNKKKFRRNLEGIILNAGEQYIFEEQKPLQKRFYDMLSRIAPGLTKKQKKKISENFDVGREEKYVIPSDARSVNTVVDDRFRVCDLDSLSLDSIHPLLYGYLERIGKVQGREGELVDFAYEFICQKKGRAPSVKEKESFRARYELQKPFENLRVAEMLVRKSQSELLGKDVNAETLKKMAIVHYNRARRGMERQRMKKEAREIEASTNVEWLKRLDDFRYFTLEREMAIDEHDYKSMLVRDLIDEGYRTSRFIPEQTPFALKAWEKARLPIGISLTVALLVIILKLVLPHLPLHDYKRDVDYSVSFHVARQLNEEFRGSELDYCTLWGDFDRSDEEKIRGTIRRNLEMYIANRHRTATSKPQERMAIEVEEYNRLFGYDWETARQPVIGGFYVNNRSDELSTSYGLDPEILRAASHASIMDLVLYSKSKRAGYVGHSLLLPMETVIEIERNRKGSIGYSEEKETQEYWLKEGNQYYESSLVACEALASRRGNISVMYSKLFAGSRTVDAAIAQAGSDDFVDYGIYLPPVARELTERALSFHIPMMLAPIPLRQRSFGDDGDYSYEPIIREFLSHDLNLNETIKALKAQNSTSAKGP